MKDLEKLSKKLNISIEQVKNMIIEEHLLNKLLSKSKLKKVDLNSTDKTFKLVSNISETLKISKEAVICSLLRQEIEKRKNDKKTL